MRGRGVLNANYWGGGALGWLSPTAKILGARAPLPSPQSRRLYNNLMCSLVQRQVCRYESCLELLQMMDSRSSALQQSISCAVQAQSLPVPIIRMKKSPKHITTTTLLKCFACYGYSCYLHGVQYLRTLSVIFTARCTIVSVVQCAKRGIAIACRLSAVRLSICDVGGL